MFDNVGKTLRLIRELRGKNQAGIARQAGLSKTQMSRYENGREIPKLPTLRKILTALEVGPFEFFYTMYLIDMQAANLDLRSECKAQGLPPLPLFGNGLLSNDTDAAVKRLIDDVMSLYHQMNAEKVLRPPHKH